MALDSINRLREWNMDGKRKPKVAVVAGSGALTSLGAVEIFHLLEEEGIPVDFTVGSSGGALACALWACELDITSTIAQALEDMHEDNIFQTFNYRTIFNTLNLPVKVQRSDALLRNEKIRALYRKIFGDRRVEDLRRPLWVHATNIENGEGVRVKKGLVADAIYASTALYPFFPPIYINGKWLADGGYSAPLPVLDAVRWGADIVIVMAVHLKLPQMPKTFIDQVFYFLSLAGDTIESHQRALSVTTHHEEIIFIDVPFNRVIKLWDQHEIPDIMKTCKAAVAKRKLEILDLINSYGVSAPNE